MKSSPKPDYDKAKQSAKTLRGEVIDLFAQIEHAVGGVLAHAATLPEYQALKPKFPHLMGQKLERLRELMSKGPLKSQASSIVPLVDKLAAFLDLRHFMVHGIVDVALKQSGDPIYEFRMLRSSDGRSQFLTLTRPEVQSRKDQLAGIAKDLESRLKSISKSL